TGVDINGHQAVLVVSNYQFASTQEFHPGGLAVVFDHQLPVALRVNTENTAVLNVGDEKIARLVEYGAFEKRVAGRTQSIRARPGGQFTLAPEFLWHSGKYFSHANFRCLSEQHHNPGPPVQLSIMTEPAGLRQLEYQNHWLRRTAENKGNHPASRHRR